MRIGIIQFPGSNCERETMLAVKRAGMTPVPFLWNEAHEKLRECAGFVIVGGFSYEDRSRAGIIAALHPVMNVIKEESQKGKPVLGICNGAQILVETGLVPGVENNRVVMALAENKRVAEGKVLGTGYYNAWIKMRLSEDYQRNAFTKHLTTKDILSVPVAHAEGRFIIPPALLQEIHQQGLAVFQYCDDAGNIINDFPVNPNGSIDNIAAISNKMGNVMAMMPHPERTTYGDAIFHSMRDFIAEGHVSSLLPLSYYPRKANMVSYVKPDHARDIILELSITDNQTLTVQQSLRQLGINVTMKRYLYWELMCDDDTYAAIKKTEVLYNPRKENVINLSQQPLATKNVLVCARDDILAQEKKQKLQDHYGIHDLHALKSGVLWQIEAKHEDDINKVLATQILFNPYAHDCYRYGVDVNAVIASDNTVIASEAKQSTVNRLLHPESVGSQ